MSYLRGKRYVAMRQTHGGDRRSDGASVNGESLKIAEPSASDGSSAQFEHLKTDEVLASEYRVSPATIRRDGQFAEDVDTIAENCGVEAKKAVLAGEANLTRKEIHEVAELPPDEQQGAIKEAVEEPAKRPRKGSKSGETRITLPSEPKALVAALVQRLDRGASNPGPQGARGGPEKPGRREPAERQEEEGGRRLIEEGGRRLIAKPSRLADLGRPEPRPATAPPLGGTVPAAKIANNT